ncbi:Transposase IS4 [Popillia japonica]|uniref:Transposase IS4 n=1 Tax=Popillia japonica TaxID=7064 RepID=A0AAW1LT84_POPJA
MISYLRFDDKISRSERKAYDKLAAIKELAKFLLSKNQTLLGTVRKSKPNTPNELKVPGISEKFSKFAFTGEVTMVAYVPKKERIVHVLSTQHSDNSISQNEYKKPIMIEDYNKSKGGVDNADKLIREYTCARRTARWPYRIFMIILDICALNAFILNLVRKRVRKIIRDFKWFDQTAFLNDLSLSPLSNILYMNNIDDKIDYIMFYLLQLFDTHAPIRTITVTHRSPPWITDNVKYMMMLRDQALAKYKKTRLDTSWTYYKTLRN